MICTKCRVACADICPRCGKKRHLREAEPTEPVFLIALTAMQAMLVEPVLKESGIPFFKQGNFGGALAMTAGMMCEVCRYFVPFAALEKARAEVENVFGADEELMGLLHEFDPSEEEGE